MEENQELNTQRTEPILWGGNMSSPTEQGRRHSIPTLDQVIAQHAAAQQQTSQHRPPQILPRPTAEPPPPEDPPRRRTPARKATKSTVSSKTKEYQNKCPPQ